MTRPVDFGRHSDDYARHRPGFPPSFYDRLEPFITLDGCTALDVGTGPGVVALELAQRGATVTGIDIAEGQIEAARAQAEARGLADRCTFLVGRAEEPDLPDASIDLLTACQCWRWFDEQRMLETARRLLRPGGLFVVAHFDYLPTRDRIAALTEDLILQINPGWTLAGKNGVFARYIDDLTDDRLEFVEQFCYDHDQPMTHEAWRGRIRTCNGVGSGGMTAEQVQTFDAALADLLRREHPDEPMHIVHRIWTVIARRSADA